MATYTLRYWTGRTPSGSSGWVLEEGGRAVAEAVSAEIGQVLAAKLNSLTALVDALELVASFGKNQPWTGLGDSKGYGVDLIEKVNAALAAARGTTT